MRHYVFLAMLPLFVILLSSCASTEKQVSPETASDESATYKYDAWRLVNDRDFEAINVLLNEADELIEKQSYDAATDKIERVLRIKPDYAPAWSRLSWLALQSNSPQRSVQMAKRSNSYAYSDPELQILNWSFIRSASQLLNDEDGYYRANQKIESLKAF
jgi:Tfp pilus assembly protein PilF